MRERRVIANGIDHHVIEWDGPSTHTVVLCHGFLDMAWSFRAVAEDLQAAGHRVVAFDWRGHGESTWIGAGGYYHFADYVLDLHELLDDIVVGDLHLLGHSMGGTACSLFAGTVPERLKTLTLVEGLGPPSHAPSITPDRVSAFLRTVTKVRQSPTKVLTDMHEVVKRMRIQNPELDDELGLWLAERATKPNPGGAGRVWRFDPLHQTTSPIPFQLESFRAFLDRITCPVLYVAGSRGFRLPDERERLAHIANLRQVEYEDTGHMIHWFEPGRLAQDVHAHLAADTAAKSP